MEKILARLKFLRRPRPVLAGSILEYGAIACGLLLITLVITDFAVFRRGAMFTGGIGDATSGFTYILFANHGWDPAWRHTGLINFPYGDSLYSPVYITWLLLLEPLWLMSRFVSPLEAMNIMTLIGYVSSGLITYWLLKRLTRSRMIAGFASYGVAFVPYHVMNSSDHLAVVFNWVTIAITAASIAVWRQPTRKRALLLGVAIAAAFYTDGYYILICGGLLLALFVGLLLIDLLAAETRRRIGRKLLAVAVSGVVALILLVPLAIVQLTGSSQISTDLANARSNVLLEGQYYGARPIDFLLPPDSNPFVKNQAWFKRSLAGKMSRSNLGESTNYLGVIPLSLCIAGLVGLVVLILRRRTIAAVTHDARLHVLAVCLLASPVLVLAMFPPLVHVHGQVIKMPMYYVMHVTAYWRVPSRIFMALQPLVIIAAALSLDWILRHWLIFGKKRMIIVGCFVVLLALEYLTPIHRPPFSQSMMPKTYGWIAQQTNIKAIEEVPIVDRPVEIAGYYAFAQLIHHKPLVNDPLAKSSIGLLNPLGDISNPATVSFAVARGVSHIVVHAPNCQTYNWGTLVHVEYGVLPLPYAGSENGAICVYALNRNLPDNNLFAYAKAGFNQSDYLDSQGHYWLALNGGRATFMVTDADGVPSKSSRSAVFSAEIGTVGGFTPEQLWWTVTQHNEVIASGNGKSGSIDATINPSQPFYVTVRSGPGRQLAAPGEVGLRETRISR